MVRNITALDRALGAKRPSRRVAFREAFEVTGDLVRDIVAMANSGGGVMFFRSPVDLDALREAIHNATGTHFADFEIAETERGTALVVNRAQIPMLIDGVVYFRRGAKSQPGTTDDLVRAIDRRVKELRRSWVSAVRRVVEAPPPPLLLLPQEIRDSESPEATPIRIVDDPNAPAFRVVDYDKTHPYRQKEILATLHARLPGTRVNQFDLLSVRHAYDTDANADFSHKRQFGTRQYSQKFIDWLVASVEANPQFFDEARRSYCGVTAPPTTTVS